MGSSVKKPFKTIDEYIALFPENIRAILKKLRSVIKAAAPDAGEAISYGMPTFKLNGNLVHFAAFKNHIGFYPTPSPIVAFKKELAPYSQAKGSVQFPIDTPIPYAVVKKIVRFRVRETEAKGKKLSAPEPKPATRRPRYPMPDFIKNALIKNRVMEAYLSRPPYQRNDYIGWINRAVHEQTKRKRLDQMIGELRREDTYMKMEYRAKAE